MQLRMLVERLVRLTANPRAEPSRGSSQTALPDGQHLASDNEVNILHKDAGVELIDPRSSEHADW